MTDLLLEFERQWREERGVPVERFLALHPELRDQPQALLVLITCELRYMKGTPEREAYLERFPQLAPELEKLFDLQDLLGSASFSQWSSETISYCASPPVPVPPAADGTLAGRATSLPLQDEFELLRKIASGQWKDVYEARQQSTQQHVALKLPRSVHAAADVASQMLREGRTQALLNHQSIPPVFALRVTDALPPVLVEKLIGGSRWSDCLDQLPLTDNLRILIQVSRAASYAHREHQLIHRDIKPENVMVSEEFGEVYLVDWGLALHVGESGTVPHPAPHVSNARGISGTPSYMAPEMALGQPWNCTTRTDVFLLGGLLYFLLSGHSPHSGPFLASVLLAAARGDIPPPEQRSPQRQIPAALSRIAMKALSYDRADRYADGGEFADAIEGFLTHQAAERRFTDARGRLDRQLAEASAREESGAQAAVLQWSDLANEFRQLVRESEPLLRGDEAAPVTYPAEARQAEVVCRQQLIDLALRRGDLTLASAQLDLLPREDERAIGDRAERLRGAVRQRRRQQRAKWVVSALAALVLGTAFVALNQALRRARAESRGRQAEAQAAEARRVSAESQRLAAQAETDRLRAEQEALRNRALPLVVQATTALRQHFHQASAALFAGAMATHDPPEIRFALHDSLQRALAPRQVTPRRIMAARLAFDSSSRLLVSTERNRGKVRVWSLDSGALRSVLEPHREHWIERPGQPGKYLTLITDCRALPGRAGEFLSAGTDGRISWWDAEQARLRGSFDADPAQIRPLTCLAVVENRAGGNWLVAAGDALDGSLSRWTWRPGELPEFLGRIAAHQPLVLSLDGAGSLLASGGADGAVRLWRDGSLAEELPFPAIANPAEHVPVAVVRFSPDGRHLAAGREDGRLCVWDLTGPAPTLAADQLLPPPANLPSSAVRDLVWLDQERWLSAASDGAVREGRLAGEPLELWQHAATVLGQRQANGVAGSPDGRWLASTGQDGNLILYDGTRKRIAAQLGGPLEEPGASQFSATAAGISAETGRVVLTGLSHDAFLRVLDAETAEEVQVFRDAPLSAITSIVSPTAVAISPDGTRVVAGERDGQLVLWDVASGEKLKAVAAHTSFELAGRASQSPWAIASLAFHPDGSEILSLGLDRTLKLWRADSLELLETWPSEEPDPEGLAGEAPATLRRALFSPSADEILVLDGEHLEVWQRSERRRIHDFSPTSRGDAWSCAEFSPDGRYLAAGTTQGLAAVWEWPSRALIREYVSEPALGIYSPFRYELDVGTLIDGLELFGRGKRRGTVQSVAFSPDDRLLSLTLGDGTVRVFDRESGRLLHVGAGHEFGLAFLSRHQVWFSPAGDLYSWGSDATVRKWDLRPHEAGLSRLELPAPASALAFSEDGEEFAAVSTANRVLRWRADSGQPMAPAGEDLEVAAVAYGRANFQTELYLLTRGGELLVIDRSQGRIQQRLTRATTAEEKVSERPADPVPTALLAVHPAGDWLATSNGLDLQLWSRSRGSWQQALELPPPLAGSREVITAITFSPRGSQLACADDTGTLQVWHLEEHRWQWQASGPKQLTQLAGLSYSPDGGRLAQSGLSPGIAIWNAETGERLQTLQGHEPRADHVWQVNRVVWERMNDGDLLASCSADGRVIFWRDLPNELIADSVLSTISLASYQGTPSADSAAVSEPSLHPRLDLRQLALDPRHRRLLVAAMDGPLRSYTLPDLATASSTQTLREQATGGIGLELRGDLLVPHVTNRLRWEVRPE